MYLAQSTNWGHIPDRIREFRSVGFLRKGENRSILLDVAMPEDCRR